MTESAKQLEHSLLEFAKVVQDRARHKLNERETRTSLIDPYLKILGWDIQDPEVCRQDYIMDRKGGHRDVDYALFDSNSSSTGPVILVEAKPCSTPIEDQESEILSQLNGYLAHSTATFGVITNGYSYMWYSRDSKSLKNEFKEGSSFVIDVSNPNSLDTGFLRAFVRSKFDVDNARTVLMDVKLETLYLHWFEASGFPNEEFVKWLTREIKHDHPTMYLPQNFNKHRLQKFKPLLERAWSRFLDDRCKDMIDKQSLIEERTHNTSEEPDSMTDRSKANSTRTGSILNEETCEIENGVVLNSSDRKRAYRYKSSTFVVCENGKTALLGLLTEFAKEFSEGPTEFLQKLMQKSGNTITKEKKFTSQSRVEILNQVVYMQSLSNPAKLKLAQDGAALFVPVLKMPTDYILWVPEGPSRKND